MKLPWILAGTALAAAAYILFNQPGPQYATGYDSVEDAAGATGRWGSKARLSGAGNTLTGKLKEGVGKLTGDDQLQGEGLGDQVAGGLKDAAGEVAQAAGQTLHDLNR